MNKRKLRKHIVYGRRILCSLMILSILSMSIVFSGLELESNASEITETDVTDDNKEDNKSIQTLQSEDVDNDEPEVAIEETYSITAANIVMTSNEARSIKANDELIELAKAKAYRESDNSEGEVRVKQTNFRPEIGVYEVTFYVVEDPSTQTTVYIAVSASTGGAFYHTNANDVVITLEDAVKITTAEDLIKITEAKSTISIVGYGTRNRETDMVSSTYKPEIGEYKVSFKARLLPDEAMSDGLTKTVTIKVVDTGTIEARNNFAIYAKGASMSEAEASKINEQQLIELCGAKVWSTKDMSEADVVIKDNNVQAKQGLYNVTFQAKDNPMLTISVVINVGDSKEKTYYTTTAENQLITLAQAQKIKNNDDLIILTNAYSKLYNVDTNKGEFTTTKVVSSNFVVAEGEYEIKLEAKGYKANKKIQKTVIVKVVDADNITVNKEKGLVITSNDVRMSETEYDNADLNVAANVQAWNLADMKKVDTTMLGYIPKQQIYYAVIGHLDVSITSNIYIDGYPRISFASTPLIVEAGKELDLMSGVTAEDDKDGDITYKVEYRTLNGLFDSVYFTEPGEYEIFYTVVDSDDNSFTASRTLIVKAADNKKVTYVGNANDVVIEVNEAEKVNSNQALIDLVDAEAWEYDGKTPVKRSTIEVASSTFSPAKGEYTVSFCVEGDPTVIVATSKIIVVENEIINKDEYMFTANPIMISKQQAKDITDEELIELTDAQAYRKDDLSEVPVAVKSHNVQGEKGIYTVIFYVDGDQTKTFTTIVNVMELSITIEASDFTIPYEKVQSLDESEIKELANVNVITDLRSRASVERNKEVKVDVNTLKALKNGAKTGGVYTLRLYVEQEGSVYEKYIQVTVQKAKEDKVISKPSKSTDDTNVVNSGDATNVNLWMGVLSLSLIAILGVAKKQKKHSKIM
ncbi:hypothetical protein M2475_000420 [Breznakia sp. PF5-3]|uniref:immunoglobulin-like domain-containing protein n=1 Tax=unclassified Breznakia TaxID=2623764 RepID=UPI002406BC85|nr:MULTISPECIES: immunoglobulin-like domain-containing protein [unclassified Breznakia]MDF9824066.1 hypothetical protein [Breznakia sp. PM6-1]MDF9834868.1 hypothetical protein [Breznakia sp. PF5-3]MDF9837110.1 hypothetical protein [Breznakia sp. PFB2-8]MDF9859035.1 hypothetical protein [Breznakia sp. PH5-24]